MGTQQYGRKLSLIVGNTKGDALDFSQFRCVFSVRRGDFQTPNAADVRIFNLSRNTANLLYSNFTQAVQQSIQQSLSAGLSPAAAQAATASAPTGQLVIQAGYEGNFGLIFRGNVKQVRLGRVDAKDSYVDITAADGDEAYNFSPMALSLAKGSTPADDLQACVRDMAGGITQGYTPDLSTNGRTRGRVFYGLARDELRDFADRNNVLWSIQDGQLTLIPKNSYIPGEVPVISPQTGLIGVPEQTQNGIIMRVLINPSLRIGQRVQLQSNAINQYRYGLDKSSQAGNALLARTIKTSTDGTYYVMRADHNGDTRGNDWITTLTCLAVDATVPVGFAQTAAVSPASGSIPQY
jgi:hypothetical protein